MIFASALHKIVVNFSKLPGLSISTVLNCNLRCDLIKPFSIIKFSIVTSTLPPLKIMPTLSLGFGQILWCKIAATPAAPAPSTTSFCFSSKNSTAFAISSSSTITMSSTHSKMSLKFFSFTSRTAIPSAIVCTDLAL